MRILQGLDGLRSLPQGLVLSVGNYDGMHRGHQSILRTARQVRKELAAPAMAVVTFEPHPLTVLRPALAPPRLTPAALKQQLLAQAGADYLAILPPTKEVLNLSAEQFWVILRDELEAAALVEGPNFNFGKNRQGTIEKLRQWTKESSVKLHVCQAVTVALLNLSVVQVSSSLIRWLLSYGRVRDAAICLGRPYTLQGKVIRGMGRGKSLGVPTANLKTEDQLIPADGVYAGCCTVAGHTYPAAISIGTLPTFGSYPQQVEVNLVGFDGDLYDQRLSVQMLDWVREQWKFASIQDLITQMQADIAYVVQRSTLDAAQGIARTGDVA